MVSASACATASLPLPLVEQPQLPPVPELPQQPPVFSDRYWKHEHALKVAYRKRLVARAVGLPCITHGSGNRARLQGKDICWACFVERNAPERGSAR